MDSAVNKAIEDVSVIKQVIQKTNKSFKIFSKIFILWGLLFIINSLMNNYMSSNSEKIHDLVAKYSFMNYLPMGVIVLLAVLIYKLTSRNSKLIGLEKHLMSIWIMILFLNIIPPKINIGIADVNNTEILQDLFVTTDNSALLYFSLAIGLIATSMFTGYKMPKYLGILFILISFIISYIVKSVSPEITMLLNFIALPLTFLFLGFYLRYKEKKD